MDSKMQGEATPYINITTKSSFPQVELPSDLNNAEEGCIRGTPHPSDKVVLSYCSELAKYTAPVTLFGGNHKVRIFHDSRAQPLVLTVGTDGRLYGLVHVDDLRESWQAVDITPGGSKVNVVAFDATETSDAVYVAVAVRADTEENHIYHGRLEKLALSADKLVLQGLNENLLGWQLVVNNLGGKDITTLTCTYTQSLHLAVGTSQSETRSASHYLIDVGELAVPWSDVPMPATAKTILSLCHGRIWPIEHTAIFTLFEDNDKTRRIVGEVLNEKTKESKHSYRLLTRDIGDVQDIYMSRNPWGWSDLVAAGTQGIGFYDHQEIDKMPRTIPGLQNISFKQVLCTEYGDALSTFSTINILAVSKDNELYFAEGRRQYSDKSISFECSGIPVQQDVRLIAGRFSRILQSSEICYVGGGSNNIGHLYRDATSGCWTSSKITVLAEQKSMQYMAYMTSIRLKDNSDTPVPPKYPIMVSSPTTVLVTLNGRANCLTPEPKQFLTDQNGHILIITQATDAMSAPVFTVSLPKFNTGLSLPKYELHANQRVTYLLKNQAPSESELRNARGSDGKPLFDANSDFSTAASIMGSFKDMSLSIEGSHDPDLNQSWVIDENGKLQQPEAGWITNAFDKAGKFLGDVIQFLKTAVKGIVKLAIFAGKGVVKLLIYIGGKPMEFILDTIGTLVTGVLSIAGTLLGKAFKGLLQLFGLWPNSSFVRDTHEVLSGIAHALMDKAELFVDANVSTVEIAAGKIATEAKKVIKDTRPKSTRANDRKKDNILFRILNNPVIQALFKFNPAGWIVEAVSEELEIDIDLPDTDPVISIFTEILPDLLMEELANLGLFFEDFFSRCGKQIGSWDDLLNVLLEVGGNAFWTLFDALKHLVFAVFKIFGALVKQFKVLLEFPMKVPFLSKLFKDETGLDFSLINIATYVVSFIACMVAQLSPGNDKKTNPADALRPLLAWVSAITKEDLDIKVKLGWTKPVDEFEAQLQQQAALQRTGKLDQHGRDASSKPSFGLMAADSDHKHLEHWSQICSATIGWTKTVIVILEGVGPYWDSVHEGDMLDYKRKILKGEMPIMPQHQFPHDAPRRKSLHSLSIAFSALNMIGHVGNLVVAALHPQPTCKRWSLAAAAMGCSITSLLVETCAKSVKFKAITYAGEAFQLKPIVVSSFATLASVFQLLSEEEHDGVTEGFHWVANGGSVAFIVGMGLSKIQPEVSVALLIGGAAADGIFTGMAGLKEIFQPHHGTVQKAVREHEDKNRKNEEKVSQGTERWEV